MSRRTRYIVSLLLCFTFLTAASLAQPSRSQGLRHKLEALCAQSYEGPKFITAQMEQQGYSADEIVGAYKELNVDWNQRAVRAALYASEQAQGGVSQMGIAKILAQIGYSNEQIIYALENSGIDWNYHAWLDANSIIKSSGHDVGEANIKFALIRLGFSKEQADYGAQHRLEEPHK